MTDVELMTIPYPQFVAGLFLKPETAEGKLAHAAVGIMGELLELRAACDREEAREELGDLRFYIEAAWMQFAPERNIGLIQQFPKPQQAAQWVAEAAAGTFLDLAKKIWIYAKPITGDMRVDMACALKTIEFALAMVEGHLGLEDVELSNRVKLIKRYPGATYTDAAAQARADKA